jgi:hypothetical protein
LVITLSGGYVSNQTADYNWIVQLCRIPIEELGILLGVG